MAANRSSTSAPVRPKSASVYRCPGPRPVPVSERIASAAAPGSGSPKYPYAASTVPNGSAVNSSYPTS